MNTHDKIKTTVYRLLTGREYSSSKIEQKLLDRNFQPADIEPVLQELRREGTVSDARFTESYLHYRKSLGYGPLRIRQELLLQGISKEMIEDHLDITDNAWFIEAKRVWQKRFRDQLPTTTKERGKQFRFLQYRGFTQEQIKTIFDLETT